MENTQILNISLVYLVSIVITLNEFLLVGMVLINKIRSHRRGLIRGCLLRDEVAS